MAVTAFWYAKAFLTFFNKEADWNSDVIKTALTTSSYTPNQDTHDYFDDVTNEVTGTGYSAGGATNGTPTMSTTTNVLTIDSDDVSWTTSTITARRAVIYDSSPAGASTRPLIIWIDFGADASSSAGTFSIVFNASGIGTVTPTDATGFP